MKKCSKCLIEKNLDDFAPRGTKRQSWCRGCKRQYDRQAYRSNIGQGKNRKERLREQSQKLKIYNRNYVWNYLSNHPCIICGEDDPVVLEFDHRDPSEKFKEISKLMNYSTKRIIDEIDKCDVLCANCHRRKTAVQFNHYESVRGSLTGRTSDSESENLGSKPSHSAMS